jgi:predicted phosphodiesterase
MRFGIISDIHANLEALEAALAWLDTQSVDEIVCLGDVVGYGPDPLECCRLVRARAKVCLMGNHDAAVVGAMSTRFYYDAARQVIEWTRGRLDQESLRCLYSLPYTYLRRDAGVGFFHSAPILPSGFFYVVRKEDAQNHARIFDRLMPVSLMGHSHLTKAFRLYRDKAKDISGKPLEGDEESKLLVNVGSVGQPRDRNPLGCCGVFDSAQRSFVHHRFDYNREETARKIEKLGLSPRFAQRLFTGE